MPAARHRALPIVLAIVIAFAITSTQSAVSPRTTQAAPGPIPVLSPAIVYVPEEFHSGGAYTAIQAAQDGRVYLGTTIYNGYAHLLIYTPAAGRFESVAEMSAATGERNPGPYAQAKIHTKPAIAPDGRVYFGTKSGKPADEPRWQQNYPGGHLLVYDPRARTTADLGIIKPSVSIIAVGVDPSRGTAYALTDPDVHLVTFDPRSRTFNDRGQFGPPGEPPTRYLVTLGNGDVYHRYGANAMARYSAASGTIERLPLVMAATGAYEAPYALTALPDGRRFIGVGNRNGQVYLFEPRDREVGVRMLGAAAEAGASTTTHYTIAAAPDGSAFYTGLAGGAELFIFRVGPDLGAPRIVGRVPPLAPPPAGYSREVARRLIVQGSTMMPDGTLIVMTAYPLRLLVFRGIAGR